MLERSRLLLLAARLFAFPLVLMVITIQSSFVHGHADHDKARFVSSSGVDSGKCDDAYKTLQNHYLCRITVKQGRYHTFGCGKLQN